MTVPIPTAKRALLDQVTDALRAVPDVVALALGGSHARGTHGPHSDLDIGLYYREASPFSIVAVRAIASSFSCEGEPTVTEFYEWGPFVNGGAWIKNDICKIDFLYRNLDQLERSLEKAEAGAWEHSYDQQPPFGFRTVTTLGEIQCCKPLYDPSGALMPLKARVAVFPPALKSHIIQSTLWGVEFSFTFAEDFARAGDIPNTVACMTRIFHYLVQALFAVNETYLINDKRVLDVIADFAKCPADFGGRVSGIFGNPGVGSKALSTSLAKLKHIFRETADLAEGTYKPRFVVPSN